MLGWHITLRRLVDEAAVRRGFADALTHPERRLEHAPEAVGVRVAVWQAAPEGLGWIRSAALRPGGIDLHRNGYPNWYLVRGRDVLPVLVERRPHQPPMFERPRWIADEGDVILSNWLGRTTIDGNALVQCRADEWLLVTVWDES